MATTFCDVKKSHDAKRNRLGSWSVFFLAGCCIGIPSVSGWNMPSPMHRSKKCRSGDMSLRAWSHQGSASTDDLGHIHVCLEDCGIISGTETAALPLRHPQRQLLDLALPRDWLEHWEAVYQHPGAYTVMRCDLVLSPHAPKGGHGTMLGDRSIVDGTGISHRWFVWGKEFHLNRLQESLACLLSGTSSDIHYDADAMVAPTLRETERIVESLLAKATTDLSDPSDGEGAVLVDPQSTSSSFVTVMLTILWQPMVKDGKNNTTVLVKGHVFSSTKPFEPLQRQKFPDPIVAVMALPPPPTTKTDSRQPQPNTATEWPTRTESHPTAKLSSWCRQRRPLETTLKHPGIGEVILVRPLEKNNDQSATKRWEVLEGLTSNIFFVYKGGVLRTAQSGVLQGYARHLVLQHAHRCGLVVQTQQHPVSLEDCGQWEEVFVTSAIRIIVPVQQLLLPRYAQSVSATGNCQPHLDLLWNRTNVSSNGEPIWQHLLQNILNDRFM